ncbi:CHAP domain-containing protein [Paracoccus caeni]|uniref:CHAP domain-containing protein n=2 Tax=Paracoccus caeni TaxID=657651 RepID=A0A934SE47_9RHOB|nr:CHAP domain-containing protein [Paracoccus caeni]
MRRLPVLCAVIALVAACSTTPPSSSSNDITIGQIDPQRASMALLEAKERRSNGQRVWCVPFARTASGINIRGNAKDWWGAAQGLYANGRQPQPGSVMAFRATGGMPLGHVAVVSEIVSPRHIRIDHANWHRNQVSMNMNVVDVSGAGDWSMVRLESQPGTYGKPYPINGFIYPQQH